MVFHYGSLRGLIEKCTKETLSLSRLKIAGIYIHVYVLLSAKMVQIRKLEDLVRKRKGYFSGNNFHLQMSFESTMHIRRT